MNKIAFAAWQRTSFDTISLNSAIICATRLEIPFFVCCDRWPFLVVPPVRISSVSDWIMIWVFHRNEFNLWPITKFGRAHTKLSLYSFQLQLIIFLLFLSLSIIIWNHIGNQITTLFFLIDTTTSDSFNSIAHNRVHQFSAIWKVSIGSFWSVSLIYSMYSVG